MPNKFSLYIQKSCLTSSTTKQDETDRGLLKYQKSGLPPALQIKTTGKTYTICLITIKQKSGYLKPYKC